MRDEVSIDFSPSFRFGVIEYMPKASIVYDRFHMMQFIQKALDEIRRQETNNNKLLKGSRFLWLSNWNELKDKDKQKLEELKRDNKVLAEAYQMKENFKEFYNKKNK